MEAKVNKLADDIRALITKYCEQKGYNYLRTNVSYDRSGSVKVNTQLSIPASTEAIKKVTQEEVYNGVAKSGTMCWHIWPPDGDYYLAEIITYRPRSHSYVFRFLDTPEINRRSHCKQFHLVNPHTKQPA